MPLSGRVQHGKGTSPASPTTLLPQLPTRVSDDSVESDVARHSIRGQTRHIATPPENDVATITVDRTSHVEIAFADGMVCRFGLNDLRLACPCAACGLARDRGLAPWPPDDHHAATLAIADAKLVGYGLSVTWSDGHSTGIYAFSALRRWCVDRNAAVQRHGAG